ncbi:MAG: TrkA family potassium uptake protein, partial [Kiritimatiellae bacterium]|nr:TrkA family potassium uptake protein [Kiritimatiellia bacterium]
VGIATYVISSITALAADHRLREAWRARKMERAIDQLKGHYLICGWGNAAPHIAAELTATGRAYVALAADSVSMALPDGAPPPFHIKGDPTDDALLERAGIRRAAGVFAAAPEDPINIVITVAARRLNPGLRIIACVTDPAHAPKMRVAGADATVSPTAIGGLRMASEMVRPAVVSFLDTMLREPARHLRVEEVVAGAAIRGRSLGDLRLNQPDEALLVAVRRGDEWRFHPPDTYDVSAGDVLVFLATPDARVALARRCGNTEAGA